MKHTGEIKLCRPWKSRRIYTFSGSLSDGDAATRRSVFESRLSRSCVGVAGRVAVLLTCPPVVTVIRLSNHCLWLKSPIMSLPFG